MASGQQVAEENVQRFTLWAATKSDDEFRGMASRGVLSRNEIATECGFAKSALGQNPRVKAALKALEDALRERGVLPPIAATDETAPPVTNVRSDSPRAAMDAERMKRLETENASLKAEVSELKRLLGRYTVLQEVLAETGRLPR